MNRTSNNVIDSRILAKAKFETPSLPDNLVMRPELFDRLSGFYRKKVVTIVAPSGFGKTTLLASWEGSLCTLSRYPRCSWLVLDEVDNDFARFWNYFVAALDSFVPKFRNQVISMLSGSQKDDGNYFLDVILETLSFLPGQTTNNEWVLILDNYHVIENSAIHSSFEYFLNNMPANFHVFCASRILPPMLTKSIMARGQVLTIDYRDLRFSEKEAACLFFSDANEKKAILPEDDFHQLFKTVDGWPAGVRLALEVLGNRCLLTNRKPFSLCCQESSAMFFVDNILLTLSLEEQVFLINSSFLKAICAPLCDCVFERNDSAQIIENLVCKNLILSPVSAGRGWFRYRTPWADVLNGLFEANNNSAKQQSFRMRASHWFEKSDMLEEAVFLAAVSGAWSRTARLVESHYLAFAAKGHFGLLTKALDRLPKSYFDSSPRINLAQAFALVGSDSPDEAVHYVRVAEKLIVNNDVALEGIDCDRLRVECLMLRATCAEQNGRVSEGKDILDRLLQEEMGNDRLLLSWIYNAVGAAAARDKDSHEAIAVLSECAAVAKNAGNMVSHLVSLYFLACRLFDIGALSQAEKIASQTMSFMQAYAVKENPFSYLSSITLGSVYRKRGKITQSLTILEEVERALSCCGGTELYVDAAVALALAQRSHGDFAASIAKLHEAIGASKERQAKRATIVAQTHLARIQLDMGQKASAYRWMVDCPISSDDEDSVLADLVTLVRARVNHAYGKTDEALGSLAVLVSSLESLQKKGVLLSALVTRGMILYALGRNGSALITLHEALKLASEEQATQVFIDEGKPMESLVRQLLHQGTLTREEREIAENIIKGIIQNNIPDPRWLSMKKHSLLTRRESVVCRLLVAGYSNKEVAQALDISENTAHSHRSSIYAKLRVNNRKRLIEATEALSLQ